MLQDLNKLEATEGKQLEIGRNVFIGSNNNLKNCSVGDNTLITNNVFIKEGCKIGRNCHIGLGAVLPENTSIPDNSKVYGANEDLVVEELTNDELRTYASELQYHFSKTAEIMEKSYDLNRQDDFKEACYYNERLSHGGMAFGAPYMSDWERHEKLNEVYYNTDL